MIKKDKYKDIEFYTGFSYVRPIYHGVQKSPANGYGGWEFNGHAFALPGIVKERPPLIEYFVEYPAGCLNKLGAGTGLIVGADANYVRATGWWNDGDYDKPFWLHYIIYDRAI